MNRMKIAYCVPVLLGSLAMSSMSPAAQAAGLTTRVAVLTRAGARTALQAAMDAAARFNAPVCVAVVDPSGTLMAFESSDGVRAGSPELALGKARSAALLQRPTSEIEDKTNQGRIAFVTSGFMSLRGGMPLREGKEMVGAIGVAGLNKDTDVKIATAAADAFAAAVKSAS